MLANNETGTIQPIGEAAALCRAHGALLHVDAVQAAGRFRSLWRRSAVTRLLCPRTNWWPERRRRFAADPGIDRHRALIAGGGQERGRRGGTPALAAIAGFAL